MRKKLNSVCSPGSSPFDSEALSLQLPLSSGKKNLLISSWINVKSCYSTIHGNSRLHLCGCHLSLKRHQICTEIASEAVLMKPMFCSIYVYIPFSQFRSDLTKWKTKWPKKPWQGKLYHRWALHQSGLHSPLCHCRFCRGWGRWTCRWHKGTWAVYRPRTCRTSHLTDPRSRCHHHTPSSLWCTCLERIRRAGC